MSENVNYGCGGPTEGFNEGFEESSVFGVQSVTDNESTERIGIISVEKEISEDGGAEVGELPIRIESTSTPAITNEKDDDIVMIDLAAEDLDDEGENEVSNETDSRRISSSGARINKTLVDFTEQLQREFEFKFEERVANLTGRLKTVEAKLKTKAEECARLTGELNDRVIYCNEITGRYNTIVAQLCQLQAFINGATSFRFRGQGQEDETNDVAHTTIKTEPQSDVPDNEEQAYESLGPPPPPRKMPLSMSTVKGEPSTESRNTNNNIRAPSPTSSLIDFANHLHLNLKGTNISPQRRRRNMRTRRAGPYATAESVNSREGEMEFFGNKRDRSLFGLRPKPLKRKRAPNSATMPKLQRQMAEPENHEHQPPPFQPRRRHYKPRNSISNGSSVTSGSDIVEHIEDTARQEQEGGHFCKCGVGTSTHNALRRHIRYFIEEWKFKCDDCGKTFFSTNYLRRHLIDTHRKTLPEGTAGCTGCGMIFPSFSQMHKHWRSKECTRNK